MRSQINNLHPLKYLHFLLSLLFTLIFLSCSKDKDQTINNDLLGTWKLTEWGVEGGFDINTDGVADSNLLNEIACPNEETLVFDNYGTVSSYKTFNPTFKIALTSNIEYRYSYNIECSEGSIGFSASYSQNNGSVTIQDQVASLDNNKLTRVFFGAIKIYNEDFTQVISTRDLTMVYTKQ